MTTGGATIDRQSKEDECIVSPYLTNTLSTQELLIGAIVSKEGDMTRITRYGRALDEVIQHSRTQAILKKGSKNVPMVPA